MGIDWCSAWVWVGLVGVFGMSKWVVDLKKNKDGTIGELSVIREDFEHGFLSYGWDGDDKKIVAGSGGPCGYKYDDRLSALLVKAANEYCELLNEAEK